MINLKDLIIAENKYCIFCGDELIRHDESRRPENCLSCGKQFEPVEYCRQKHFICPDCSGISVNDIIKSICMTNTGTDPIALAVSIMQSPLVMMQGAEHHFIVPAVLLTCCYNLLNQKYKLAQRIQLAEKMAKEAAPVCTDNIGSCGAAIGTIIFFNIFLDSDIKGPQDLDLNIVKTETFKRIAQMGEPRCCKRDTYFAIEETIDFLKKELKIILPKSDAKCTFSLRNQACKREDCTFYNIGWSLV